MVTELLKIDKLLNVLRKLEENEEMTISELYALWRSSTFIQKWVPELERKHYIECVEIMHGNRRFKKCRITEKGRKLRELLEQLKQLDEAQLS